jgi:N-methylhydantoinase A
VTDANLYLGYLADGAKLGAQVRLNRELAERALSTLGSTLNLNAHDTARGIAQLADTQMTQALRVISVERGLDPRDYALMAFGGAGPMHACSLAEALDMTTVLIPRASGVLSALGLAVSDVRRDYTRPLLRRLDQLRTGELNHHFSEMESQAHKDLENAQTERHADLRYRGQSFELTIDAADTGSLADTFHKAHESRYGYRMDNQPLEVVALRLIVRQPVERPTLKEAPADQAARPEQRRINIDGDWQQAPVWQRAALGAGSRIKGPAIITFDECTCLIRPHWTGEIDDHGTLILEYT